LPHLQRTGLRLPNGLLSEAELESSLESRHDPLPILTFNLGSARWFPDFGHSEDGRFPPCRSLRVEQSRLARRY